MNEIIARIVNKYKNKSEEIFIVHNDINYRLIIKKDIIEVNNFNIGDIIKFTGTKISGKYSNEYVEYDCSSIAIIKKTSLSSNESAINEKNKFKGAKERQFFHTKMITDNKCIEKLKIYDLVVKNIRSYLDKENFVECRTPILTNSFHGGGAFPFETYVNYKHKKNYLRANSILPLSMYLAGGLNRVFEIGEYFRNGSITKTHSVPYLAAEIYATNINYEEILVMAKNIFMNVIKNVNKNFKYNISEQIETISFEQFMKQNEFSNFSINNLKEYFEFKKIDFIINNYENINNLYRLFKEEIVPKTSKNMMIEDLPSGISPFIDCLEDNEKLLKRTLFFYKGHTIMEITYSSNDAKIILQETHNQKQALKQMNKEMIDKSCEGYEHALKLGILPMSSITISVERLVSLICENENINENLIDV